jgi:hypothetical protein
LQIQSGWTVPLSKCRGIIPQADIAAILPAAGGQHGEHAAAADGQDEGGEEQAERWQENRTGPW